MTETFKNNRAALLQKSLLEVANLLEAGEGAASPKAVEAILRTNSKRLQGEGERLSKKELLSFYLREKEELLKRDELSQLGQLDDAIVKALRAKPRRSASGVATVTLIMKPWPCGGDCICCPSDVRMPKSYLSDEPACQRAERLWFDPYLQMSGRLGVLADMGHNTDKVEVIILGGTFSDYPEGYQVWFVEQAFEALNDFGSEVAHKKIEARRHLYTSLGLDSSPESRLALARDVQEKVNRGELSYNEVVADRSGRAPLARLADEQVSTLDSLREEHRKNESAASRCVGLVVETRPELVTRAHLKWLRALGCTKLQIGVQALDDDILSRMGRAARASDIARAFALLREAGFKSHVHMMANLPGATPESDKRAYTKLVSDPRFMPDEIKLYPCSLVTSAHLTSSFADGSWAPYDEQTLTNVLAHCLLETPVQTRISRMIRDISSNDIIAGNKKTNLRQLVEIHANKMLSDNETISEMRVREISTTDVLEGDLTILEHEYSTSNTTEYFLEYTDASGALVAFCRLSLPNSKLFSLEDISADTTTYPEAMIREVHVYGRVSRLHEATEGTQHLGLGRNLISRACDIAKSGGYKSIAVISAIGTRLYYASLGFSLDAEQLYQHKAL